MHLLNLLLHALRQWTRRPWLGTLAVLPLALAIAALTALFTVVNVSLLRPLPGITAPEGLVEIGRPGGGFGSLSYPDFRDIAAQSQSLAQVYAWSMAPLSVRPDGAESAGNSFAFLVSDSYFSALGVRAEAGRLLQPGDMTQSGDTPAAVISHAAWQRLYGRDRAVVGRTLTINGSAFVIVGIAAPGFRGHIAGISPEFFLPLTRRGLIRPTSENLVDNRLAQWLMTGARLAEGRSLGEAQAELATIGERLTKARQELGEDERFPLQLTATPLRPLPAAAMRGVLIFAGVLGVLVTTLLLVACINVAGLSLARAEERRSELAVRLSLGASRWQLSAMMLAESLLLALAASGLGVALAWAGLRLLLAVPLPIPLPLHFDLTPDAHVLGFAALLALVTAGACGLLPAWRAASSRLAGEMKRFRGQRAQQVLSVLQVTATLVLLVGGGAILRATQQSEVTDPGIRVSGVLTLEFDLATSGYASERAVPTAERLLEAARGLPGVSDGTLAAVVPLTLSSMSLGNIQGEGLPPDGLWPDTNVVSPGFTRVLDIPLRGRDFDSGDVAGRPPVAIINRHLAGQIFGEADPVGRRFSYGEDDDRRELTVVGVIEDSQYASIGEAQRGYLLLPLAQQPMNGLNLLLRSDLEPAQAAAALATAIRRIDPNLPPPQVFRLADQAAIALLPQRIASLVIGSLSAVGLLLVSLGLYGLLSQFVYARLREFGVRQALGAAPAQIAREVRSRGLRLVGVGVLLALPLSLLVLQLVAGLFVGVNPMDLPLLLAAGALLLGIATVACLIPARRAARTAPSAALRYE